MTSTKLESIEPHYLSLDDYQELKAAMILAYGHLEEPYWQQDEVKNLITRFPEGQVIIKINGQLAGCALSIIVAEDLLEGNHTYREVTGDYTFSTHDAGGDILYGIDVFIMPEFRGMRLGHRLYDYRKDLCEKLNLRSIAFGGRTLNYHEYAEQLSPKQYISKVRRKEIHDPVLNF